METNKLSKKIAAALNAQIDKQATAAQIYLTYAYWAEKYGYRGISNFLFRISLKERNNMLVIIEYIYKRGSGAKIAAIPLPPENPENISACLEELYRVQEHYTNGIKKILKMSWDEKDVETYKFIQWYIKEQAEDETIERSFLNRIEKSNYVTAETESPYQMENESARRNVDSSVGINIRLQNPNLNSQRQ